MRERVQKELNAGKSLAEGKRAVEREVKQVSNSRRARAFCLAPYIIDV